MFFIQCCKRTVHIHSDVEKAKKLHCFVRTLTEFIIFEIVDIWQIGVGNEPKNISKSIFLCLHLFIQKIPHGFQV